MGALLQQDGSALLQQDGSRILIAAEPDAGGGSGDGLGVGPGVIPALLVFSAKLTGAAPDVNRNFALRSILALVRLWKFLTRQPVGDDFALSVTVSDKQPVRPADPLIFQTTVSNLGSSTVTVYENDTIVCLVPAGQKKTLPVSGRSNLSASAASGSAQITIASSRRKSYPGEVSNPPYGTPIPTVDGDIL